MIRKKVLVILLAVLCSMPVMSIQADEFVFSRNGITWASTWKEILEEEDLEKTRMVFTQAPYPGFKNMTIYAPYVAGFEATSLNYLFYNENFLAVFYEFGWRFKKPGEDYTSWNANIRNANFFTLISALDSKYGNKITGEKNWLKQHLSEFPDSLLEYFDVVVSEDILSWQVATNTIVSLVFYKQSKRQEQHAALVYLNLDKLNNLGFDILPGFNTEGL